jgi:Arc/MetJ family transcription regulator
MKTKRVAKTAAAKARLRLQRQLYALQDEVRELQQVNMGLHTTLRFVESLLRNKLSTLDRIKEEAPQAENGQLRARLVEHPGGELVCGSCVQEATP